TRKKATRAGDHAGIEPAWSRLRVECINHLCQSPRKFLGRRGGNRTHMNLIRSQVPDPFSHTPSYNWCRMLESNQLLAIIDRGLDLRANPAWCAVRELNPHLLGVGQLFWSVELPAQKCGGGYRSRTCLAALIWRRSAYKALPLAGGPSMVARDGFEPSA